MPRCTAPPSPSPICSWCLGRRPNFRRRWCGSWHTPSSSSSLSPGANSGPASSPRRWSTSPVVAADSAGSTTSEHGMTGELYRDEGVVLRTYKLAESDRIVVIMTAEHGKIRAVAKGVRKTKSKFGARLEPMSHVSLLLYEGRELDIVSQAESIDHFRTLRDDLDGLTGAMLLLEAVDQIA